MTREADVPGWLPPVAEDELAVQTRGLFTDRFGGHPDGVWVAPGRVNLIGEHIDYVGARVLPFALPYATAVALRLRDDDVLRCASSGQPQTWAGTTADVGPHAPRDWPAYAVGVPWAMARHGTIGRFPGADIAVHSSLPQGAGLSSSAALETAVALGIAELLDVATDEPGRVVLARDCVHAENVVAGASTGGMDQSVALRATAGHALLLDCTDSTVEHIALDLAVDDLELLIINTNAPHRLVDSDYGVRRAQIERVAARMGQHVLRKSTDIEAVVRYAVDGDPELTRLLRHVLTEIRRVETVATALRSGAVGDIGEELSASHRSLRDDYAVSSIELDTAVDAARDAGALGARMVGGGFGGSAIALIPVGTRTAVAEHVRVAAAGRGLPGPQFLTGYPKGSAHRVG
ncbi:galactokinase family protein [Mycolicibacterium sp. CR10]|uniref:galactokinase n=1 Tax=Mycolicibacterium sp. CR10 TaxID=2562314 RepID=UPI001F0D745D|nr:galactokinase family protein [Mycolicibacterium sp. CR10]